MAMDAFDLAERFQTLVFVMSDLDLGMNTWMSHPFEYPDRPLDRGKLLDEAALARLGGVGTLQGRGRRRDSVPHDPRRRHAVVLHARLRPQREGAVQRAARRLREQRRSARAEVRDGQEARAGADRRATPREPKSASSPTGRATGRSTRAATSSKSETGLKTAYLRMRAYPFTDEVRDFVRRLRPRLRRRAEPRRADARLAAPGNDAGEIGRLRSVPALQRPADRRAIGHRRHPGAGRRKSRESATRAGISAGLAAGGE